MSEIQKLHDIALANVLDPDDGYYFRAICRFYSEKFHTPLHEVYRLPIHTVLINYFEATLEMLDEDDVEEKVAKAVDPNFGNNEEESIQDFIGMIEEEIAGKRKVKKKLMKDLKDGFPVLNEGKGKPQSLQKGSATATSGRRVFTDEQLAGDGTGDLSSLDELLPKPSDDEGGTELS